jgi:hypothetical protein
MSKICFFILICSSLAGFPLLAIGADETITISTYYPSPYGIYSNLEVKDGLAIGDISTSPIGSMANLTGGQLFINGSIILNSLSTYPTNPQAGQIFYYTGGGEKTLKVYNSTAWVDIPPPPAFLLVNGNHTNVDCTFLGGSVQNTDVSEKACAFPGASCPSGWTQYKNFGAYTNPVPALIKCPGRLIGSCTGVYGDGSGNVGIYYRSSTCYYDPCSPSYPQTNYWQDNVSGCCFCGGSYCQSKTISGCY